MYWGRGMNTARGGVYSSVPGRIMRAQRATLLGLVIIVCCSALILTSCGDPIGDNGKSPVMLVVGTGDVWGKQVDVYTPSVSGGVTDEAFEVTIRSIYKNQVDPPTTVFADVLIQEYRVTYYRPDGNTNVPEPFVNPLQALVPAAGEATLNILLLRRDAKLQSPLKELAFGGGEGEIHLNAVVEFYGEDLAGNAVATDTVITIWAADYPG